MQKITRKQFESLVLKEIEIFGIFPTSLLYFTVACPVILTLGSAILKEIKQKVTFQLIPQKSECNLKLRSHLFFQETMEFSIPTICDNPENVLFYGENREYEIFKEFRKLIRRENFKIETKINEFFKKDKYLFDLNEDLTWETNEDE